MVNFHKKITSVTSKATDVIMHVYQANIWRPLPSLVFGMFATLSGLSFTLMPETLGQPLPDTVEEVEHNSRKMNAENRRR